MNKAHLLRNKERLFSNKVPLLQNNLRLWGSNLGINGSRESVGFGLSVRAERTGSPSGRTKDKLSEDERFGKLIDDNAGSNGDIHGVFGTQLGNLQATI